jgi:hypothetical protein
VGVKDVLHKLGNGIGQTSSSLQISAQTHASLVDVLADLEKHVSMRNDINSLEIQLQTKAERLSLLTRQSQRMERWIITQENLLDAQIDQFASVGNKLSGYLVIQLR